MEEKRIIDELGRNREVFRGLLQDIEEQLYLWKPGPGKWCLLEVICHLYDEERDDFRARTRHVLENPTAPMTPFDPLARVSERKYMQQDFNEKLQAFLQERIRSVKWLQSLQNPHWENTYAHPKLGPLTAKMFLSNWLAHDYLHIRQINRIKYEYLKTQSGENLNYAGQW